MFRRLHLGMFLTSIISAIIQNFYNIFAPEAGIIRWKDARLLPPRRHRSCILSLYAPIIPKRNFGTFYWAIRFYAPRINCSFQLRGLKNIYRRLGDDGMINFAKKRSVWGDAATVFNETSPRLSSPSTNTNAFFNPGTSLFTWQLDLSFRLWIIVKTLTFCFPYKFVVIP